LDIRYFIYFICNLDSKVRNLLVFLWNFLFLIGKISCEFEIWISFYLICPVSNKLFVWICVIYLSFFYSIRLH
jgi:hypothetical protein